MFAVCSSDGRASKRARWHHSPLWSGSISFGLVNVPVRLFSATREHKAHFHFVHSPDAGPIGYQKVCKTEDKPVPDDEVVLAFEVAKGEYVFLDDTDFEQARGVQERAIEILDFVPAEEIGPSTSRRRITLALPKEARRSTPLFLRALRESSLIGVVKFHLRERQHLGGLRVPRQRAHTRSALLRRRGAADRRYRSVEDTNRHGGA